MDEEKHTDVINGQEIDLDSLSIEQLENLKQELEQQEKALLDEVDRRLTIN